MNESEASPGVWRGRALVEGSGSGVLLHSTMPLSFWGGVDPATGMIVDGHHPLSGQCLAGKILALPGSRGSCSGSGVLLELMLNGKAPAALVVEPGEEVLTLGAIVAQELFGRSLPILEVDKTTFRAIAATPWLQVSADRLSSGPLAAPEGTEASPARTKVELSDNDRATLDGKLGPAAQRAMRIVLRMAEILGAERLLDVTRAHIDGCIYTGAGGLAFAEQFLALGGRVAVPTTLNAVSVDCGRWRELGVAADFGEPAERLARTYLELGARPSFTCAPYLGDSVPGRNEQIAWAESNAVVFANSVLGARTMKYPDYLDLCIALTGRAPMAGCHVDAARCPTLRIDVPKLDMLDDSFWPLLGYLIGQKSPNDVPLVVGLGHLKPTRDDLKAFGAAFATTSGAPMFHLAGITPEAMGPAPEDLSGLSLTEADFESTWHELNGAPESEIDLVAIGSPHASADEIATLARLVDGHHRRDDVRFVVTVGRSTMAESEAQGTAAALRNFGATFVTDTCWCMLGAPIVARSSQAIMTNSGKYAHYAPGLVDRRTRFGSLADCVRAATSGRAPTGLPLWLRH